MGYGKDYSSREGLSPIYGTVYNLHKAILLPLCFLVTIHNPRGSFACFNMNSSRTIGLERIEGRVGGVSDSVELKSLARTSAISIVEDKNLTKSIASYSIGE